MNEHFWQDPVTETMHDNNDIHSVGLVKHCHSFRQNRECRGPEKSDVILHLHFQWHDQVTKGWIRFRLAGDFVLCSSFTASTSDTLKVYLAHEPFIHVLRKLSGTTHPNASTFKVQLYIHIGLQTFDDRWQVFSPSHAECVWVPVQTGWRSVCVRERVEERRWSRIGTMGEVTIKLLLTGRWGWVVDGDDCWNDWGHERVEIWLSNKAAQATTVSDKGLGRHKDYIYNFKYCIYISLSVRKQSTIYHCEK